MAAEKKPEKNPYLESDEDVSDDDSDVDNKDDMKEIVQDIEGDKWEEQGPETKWAKLKATVREWGETSSCHGIPHMSHANTACAVLVWSIILIFCAIGFVFLFSNTLMQYLRFDKIVRLNLGLEQTNFPSITFCNINPYKMSRIKDVPELNALLTVYESSASGSLLTP